MRDACLFGRVREGATRGVFIAPVCGIDESKLSAFEETADEFLVCDFTFDQLYVGQLRELLRDNAIALAELRPYVPADGRGDADEACCLAAGAVDGDEERWLCRWHACGGCTSSEMKLARPDCFGLNKYDRVLVFSRLQ